MYVGTFQIREVISRNITPLQKRVINEKRWPCIKNLVIIRELYRISFYGGNRE